MKTKREMFKCWVCSCYVHPIKDLKFVTCRCCEAVYIYHPKEKRYLPVRYSKHTDKKKVINASKYVAMAVRKDIEVLNK